MELGHCLDTFPGGKLWTLPHKWNQRSAQNPLRKREADSLPYGEKGSAEGIVAAKVLPGGAGESSLVENSFFCEKGLNFWPTCDTISLYRYGVSAPIRYPMLSGMGFPGKIGMTICKGSIYYGYTSYYRSCRKGRSG